MARASGLLQAACLAAALAGGCDPDEASTPSGPDAPAPQTSSRTLIRAANFASDLPQVNVLVDGGVQFASLAYTRITSYQEISGGTHRVEVRASDPSLAPPDPLRATVAVATGQALTLSVAGLVETHSLRVLVFEDDLATDPARARIKFVNLVPDFPTGFDLSTDRTGLLFVNVGFGQASGYRALEQANYDFEVRRAETLEVVIPVSQGLARNATYTLFAYGSLRRGDFSGRVAIDAGSGAPAQRQ